MQTGLEVALQATANLSFRLQLLHLSQAGHNYLKHALLSNASLLSGDLCSDLPQGAFLQPLDDTGSKTPKLAHQSSVQLHNTSKHLLQ